MANVSAANSTIQHGGFLEELCTDDVDDHSMPSAYRLIMAQDLAVNLVVAFCGLCTLFNIALFVESAVFIVRHFKSHRNRRNKTIQILALMPIFSFASLLAVLVPKSSTIIDLVLATYLGTALYRFLSLLTDYFGDRRMEEALSGVKRSLRGPPACCCCVCCPVVAFSPTVYIVMKTLVMQVAIMRPLLMLLAAVLWTNGSYHPGVIESTGGFIYISVLNAVSTLTAMYALHQLTSFSLGVVGVFTPKAKLCVLQIILVVTGLLNLLLGILVTSGVIPCGPVLSSKGRAQRIYHMALILLMIPLGLLGRRFYRVAEEGSLDVTNPDKPLLDDRHRPRSDANTQTDVVVIVQPRAAQPSDQRLRTN